MPPPPSFFFGVAFFPDEMGLGGGIPFILWRCRLWGFLCRPVLVIRWGVATSRGILCVLGRLLHGLGGGFGSGLSRFPPVSFPLSARSATIFPSRSRWGCPLIHILPATCFRDSSSSLCPYAVIQARRAASGVSPSGLHSLDSGLPPLALALALSMKLPVCHLYLPRRWSLLRKSFVSTPPFSVISMLSRVGLGVSSTACPLVLSFSSASFLNIRGIFLLSLVSPLGSEFISVSPSPMSGVLWAHSVEWLLLGILS